MKIKAREIIGISSMLFIILAIQLIAQNPPPNLAVNFKELANFGTAIGGIFAFISIYLVYKTLNNQRKSSKTQAEAFNTTQFESRVFELLRYHRDNVDITEMRNPSDKGEKYFKGHKAFREIYRQFEELLKYVVYFLEGKELHEIFKTSSDFEVETDILSTNGIASDLHKRINEINIAYLILFFGVHTEGRKALEAKLHLKYDVSKLTPLLNNLSTRISLWSLKEDAEEKEELKNGKEDLETWTFLNGDKPYKGRIIKFYGGHQYRLGHLFRHLFQTLYYIDTKGKSYEVNYEYVKIVRAQLSSYEQQLLFINSISDVGRAWELKVDHYSFSSLKMSLSDYIKCKAMITKYDLIRNIPNNLGYIKISEVYKNLAFEGDKENEVRKALNKLYNDGYY